MREEERYEIKHRILEWYLNNHTIDGAHPSEVVAEYLGLPKRFIIALVEDICKDGYLIRFGSNDYAASGNGAYFHIVLGGYKQMYTDLLQERLQRKAETEKERMRQQLALKATERSLRKTHVRKKFFNLSVTTVGITSAALIILWISSKSWPINQVKDLPQNLESVCHSCQSLQPPLDSLERIKSNSGCLPASDGSPGVLSPQFNK